MATRVTDGARWTAALVLCLSRLRRSCAHALPLLNLVAVYQCSYPTWYLVMLKLSLYKSSILPHLTQPSPQGFSLKIWVFKGKPLGTRLHLPHCHLAWHFCNASDRRKLERIQERGLRAVYKTRSVSYQDLLDGAKLPMLYNTRGVRQDIATLMFKVI